MVEMLLEPSWLTTAALLSPVWSMLESFVAPGWVTVAAFALPVCVMAELLLCANADVAVMRAAAETPMKRNFFMLNSH